MVTILWSVTGFHVVNAKPTNVRFNSSYMCDIILPELLEKKHEFMGNPNENPMYIHLDNCLVHNSKKNKLFFHRPQHTESDSPTILTRYCAIRLLSFLLYQKQTPRKSIFGGRFTYIWNKIDFARYFKGNVGIGF